MIKFDMLKMQLGVLQYQLDATREVYKDSAPQEGEPAYAQFVVGYQIIILSKAIQKLDQEIAQQEMVDSGGKRLPVKKFYNPPVLTLLDIGE